MIGCIDAYPISARIATSVGVCSQSETVRGGTQWMDDWSFPCGLKINGRGLLILGIDYQMVGPGKHLLLMPGLETNGDISI